MPTSHASASKTIVKKTPRSASVPVNKVVRARNKDLSFSFHGECMADVVGVFAAIFKTENALPSLCQYSASTTAPDPGVEGVLVFRLYDCDMARFIMSIETTLEVMAELGEDIHVINETLNFTSAYDGTRTHTGEQRDNLMDLIDEKFADIDFTPCFIK
jgi:hypothetical protein